MKALPYEDNKISAVLGRKDVKTTKAESSGLPLGHNGITIRTSVIAHATTASKCMGSKASLASNLLELFEESSTHLFIALVCDIAINCCGNVSGAEVRLTFVNSGNIIKAFIIIIGVVALENT